MKINLVYISTAGWSHSQGLREVIIYFDYYLNKMGHDVTISKNYFDKKNVNIIFFSFMLPLNYTLPKNSIIYQSEDLNKTTSWIFEGDKGKMYFDFLEKNSVIDYSITNLEKINNKKKFYLPLLYCEKLLCNFSRKEREYILFYGSMTPYRKALLENISKKNKITIITAESGGDYSFHRDKLIMESLGVLNLHKNENCNVFESVRCFYPLINNIPVFSEETDEKKDLEYYKNSVLFFKRNSHEDFYNLLNKYRNNKNEYLDNINKFKNIDAFKIFREIINKLI
jgi:hypothetical protein